MAENSKIEWTDHTFNPWIGCTKVHAGCANCYAEADQAIRRGRVVWGTNGTRSKTKTWGDPVKWNRKAPYFVECANPDCRYRRHVTLGHEETFCPKCGDPEANSARPRVFCASLADVFEDWQGPIHHHNGQDVLVIPEEGNSYWLLPQAVQHNPVRLATMHDLRRDLFELIDATPQLDWLLLTKRPENVRRMWPDRKQQESEHYYCEEPHYSEDAGEWVDGVHRCRPAYRNNVGIGTSVSDQASFDKQWPQLYECRDLSPVLFLSIEPLLGPLRLSPSALRYLGWVIVGGESGTQARPMHPQWVRDLREQCTAAGVPFFFKQWGEWKAGSELLEKSVSYFTHEWGNAFGPPVRSFRVGKKRAGRLLDGREWSEFPSTQELTTDQRG